MEEGLFTHEFKVGMTCEGCSGAVTKILDKVEGIQSFSTDVPNQKLLVVGPEGI